MGFVQQTLVAQLLCLSFITCEVYYITPSTTFLTCPSDLQVCFSLKQFADNNFNNIEAAANATLKFLSGNHTLDSELKVMNLSEFLMYSDIKDAWINCNGIGSLTFINVNTVLIRNLAFLGCGENILQQVNLLTVQDSIFHGYYDSGTALYMIETVANITKSSFLLNTGTFQYPVDNLFLQGDDYKEVGGAITAFQSTLGISECRFHRNSAEVGGVLFLEESIVSINNTIFDNNFADPHVNNRTTITGGVMVAYWNSIVSIQHSNFSNNSGLLSFHGVFIIIYSNITIGDCIFQNSSGSVLLALEGNVTDYNSIYKHNNCTAGAVLNAQRSNVKYISSQFTNNHASLKGGVIYAYDIVLTLQQCNLNHNTAIFGGVIDIEDCNISVEESTFSYNKATLGSVIQASQSKIILMDKTVFYKNNAQDTGVIYAANCSLAFKSIAIINNCANNKGVLYAVHSTIESAQKLLILGNLAADASIVYLDRSRCNFTEIITFSNNSGSLLIINSLVIFYGITRFLNCSQPVNNFSVQKGGAITIIESTTYFIGETLFIRNHARIAGGAIHATGSTIHMSGEITISNNTAGNSAGGVYLYQSKLNCVRNCTFSGNTARKSGGAIHAVASTVYADDAQRGTWTQLGIQKPVINYSLLTAELLTTLLFTYNKAQMGGALALEMNSKLYGNSYKILFKNNLADYGGAIYVNDYTNSGTCASKSYAAYSASTECFIQTINYYHDVKRKYIDKRHYQFVDNYAAKSGPSLYGGLLDRCTVSPITDLMFKYLDTATSVRITPVSSSRVVRSIEEDTMLISSAPVRICFCRDMDPDCNYQWPVTRVKKGHLFVVTLVAVDQVNHTINATIRSYLSSQAGGLGRATVTKCI